ncbi:MAG TPA: IPT/TIG domain-containing protein [Pyrinomonadaceae bacterium]|nr:IPT/TIG domain-containing protein [Pyrinomonadaceae bacterium]
MVRTAGYPLKFSLKTLFLIQVMAMLLLVAPLANSQSGEILYIYDELGRLVGVIDPAGNAAIYSYDAVGNLLSISRRTAAEVSIIDFTPNSGAVGTTVTIYGTGFSTTPSQNSVNFNGVSANVTAATANQITTTVPTAATTGSISMTTPLGNAISSTSFVVTTSAAPTITSFTPTIGSAGTAVSITGTNFETPASNNKSKFNITNSANSSATSTTIATSVPSVATSGHISVSTSEGTAVSADDFFVPPSPYTAVDVAATGRMNYGESRTVPLSTANKIGLLVFDGVAEQRASIKVTSSDITGSALTIYSPNGTPLASASANTSGGYLETPILPMTGTYTILIDPNSTYSGTLTFTLYNATDVFGSISINGPSVVITTTVPGQNTQVAFAGNAGQRVSLGMSGVTMGVSSSGTKVSINNPDGTTLLAVMDVGTNGAGTSTLTLPATGTYSISVDPQGANNGSITLTFSEEVAGTITSGGASLPLSLSRPGQNAQISFDGTTGQQVTVRVTSNSMGSVTVKLLQPEGTQLTSKTSSSSSFNLTTQTLSVTGAFAITIDPAGANTGSLNVSVTNP